MRTFWKSEMLRVMGKIIEAVCIFFSNWKYFAYFFSFLEF